MTFLGWLTIFLFVAILTALALPLGRYLAAVYTGEHVFLDRILGGPERLLYRIIRTDPNKGQDWKAYAKSLILFSLAGWLLLYFILRTQTLWNWTGLNPEGFHSAPWNVTFNTTSSFMTNTNWQYYGGETTMSYFSQMAGLTVQNFLSAGVGIVVAVAVDPRDHRPQRQEHRQLLAGHRPNGSLRPAAAVDHHRAGPRLAGRDSDVRGLPDRARDHRSEPDDRRRAGRLPGGDQGAGHQRRRFLQHELGAPVREPDRLHQLLRDARRARSSQRRWCSCTGA